MADGSGANELKSDQYIDMKSEVYEWVEAIVFSIAVIVLIFTFLFRIVSVSGFSMENTLQDGNRVIISDVNYTPKQYDIVVVTTKAVPEPIIKRVIAVAGQTVNIDYVHNKVYVGDGKTMKAINEPFIKEPMQQAGDIKLPAKVPPHCIFVMGDNRNNSKDSRFSDVGMINDNDILGRAVFRIYPIDELGLLH